MKIISVTPLALSDIKVVKFARFTDERGYFTETIRVQDLTTAPKLPELHDSTFYQVNESMSKKNVFRGLHFQWEPHMGKLVRALDGQIIDMAVDIRTNSETFGKIVLFELTFDPLCESQDWLWIPPGFAHGFLAMTDNCRIEYACTGWWNPQSERGITIFDTSIDWSVSDENLAKKVKLLLPKAIINQKDKDGLTLAAWKQSEDALKFADTLPKTKIK